MADLIKYKGYSGSVEYSKEDECFFGKVQSVRSLLLYDGASLNELMAQFRQVVDNYLEDCRVDGVEPERSESGDLDERVVVASDTLP